VSSGVDRDPRHRARCGSTRCADNCSGFGDFCAHRAQQFPLRLTRRAVGVSKTASRRQAAPKCAHSRLAPSRPSSTARDIGLCLLHALRHEHPAMCARQLMLGSVIELAQQRRLPAVPYVGADGADVHTVSTSSRRQPFGDCTRAAEFFCRRWSWILNGRGWNGGAATSRGDDAPARTTVSVSASVRPGAGRAAGDIGAEGRGDRRRGL